MSWRTTLVQPVSPDRLTLVEVACTWCRWTEGLFDAATEEGRAALRGVRVDHTCQSPQMPPEGS